jgi:uncharacterized protein involved in exopolysaccharide biosynthesis
MKTTEANATQHVNARDEELTLNELIVLLWQGKWIVIGVSFFVLAIFTAYAISLPNIYKSSALLSPAEANSSAGMSGLGGQLGGLASLAGVSLGGGNSNQSALAIEIIKSRQFASNFIERHDLLKNLMAAEQWNAKANQVQYDPDIYDSKTSQWVREVSFPYNEKPSLQEAYEKYLEFIKVSEDKTTGLVTITAFHVSPTVAKDWVDWIIKDINQVMKNRDVREANKSISFLTKQLEQTAVAEMKGALYSLIEEQAKTIMFANVRDEYVFKTIDPAIASQKKHKPSRAIICIIGLLVGGFLGGIIVLIRYFINLNHGK